MATLNIAAEAPICLLTAFIHEQTARRCEMALVFDLNTGTFCEDTSVSSPPKQHQSLKPHPADEPGLDLALSESTLHSTGLVDSMPADLVGTDAVQFISTMQRKSR